jgi:hypothetical protein
LNYLKKEAVMTGRATLEAAAGSPDRDTAQSIFTQEEEDDVEDGAPEAEGRGSEVGGVAGVQVVDFLRDIGLDREIRCMEMVDPRVGDKVRHGNAGREQRGARAAVSARGAQRGHPEHEGGLG